MKIGWKVGEEKWPCAYEAICNFAVDIETVGGRIARVDLEGREVSEAVQGWLDANEDVWKPWTACAG
jgi:glycine betaine/proline transport system substrate-binding protein